MSGIFMKYTGKVLKENRSRTLVTIVGIILSVALLTAVSVSISSALSYMEQVAMERSGNWSVRVYQISEEVRNQMAADGRVKGYTALEDLGYARIGSSNKDKPYLFVGGMDEHLTEVMPIHLTEGRLPEREGELLIPAHLEENGGVTLTLGQTLTLEMGQRYREDIDEPLDQRWNYQRKEGGDSYDETFVPDGRKITYRVVGFYERPVFENRWAPGYTALTVSETETTAAAGNPVYEMWLRLKEITPQAQGAFVGDYIALDSQEAEWTENDLLLRYTSFSSGNDVILLLYSLGVILMIMVAAGSIALIYNAFSISVTERIRQFGLLRSLGATKRQIRNSVLWEGLSLCFVAVPIGFVVGCLGITITVWLCRDLFAVVMRAFGMEQMFTIRLSWEVLLSTVAVSLITVLISAWLPARRVLKIPPMEAIRQSHEIKEAYGKGWLSRCFLGLEGRLASQNFRRNRKRYRSTILSLAFSVILFVCANSFCHYLIEFMESGPDGARYDVSCRWDSGAPREVVQESYEKLKTIEEMEDSALVIRMSRIQVSIDPEDMSKEYRRYWEERDQRQWIECNVFLIEEETYAAYLEKEGIEAEPYLDKEWPMALVYDRMRVYDDAAHTSAVYKGLQKDTDQLELLLMESWNSSESGRRQTISVGKVLDKAPWFADSSNLMILLPESAGHSLGLAQNVGSYLAAFLAPDYGTAHAKMETMIDEAELGSLYSPSANAAEIRAFMVLIRIFSGGFLALISLITAANIFNTISTSVLLRRREFAMLQSIGMTGRSLEKILRYECLIYGSKSLLYAMPVAVGITWLMYDTIRGNGYFTGFYIPWSVLTVAVGAVFVIVGAAMVYAGKKLQVDSLADALRNENV